MKKKKIIFKSKHGWALIVKNISNLAIKKIIKPQLETVVSILEQKYPGTSCWYCRK